MIYPVRTMAFSRRENSEELKQDGKFDSEDCIAIDNCCDSCLLQMVGNSLVVLRAGHANVFTNWWRTYIKVVLEGFESLCSTDALPHRHYEGDRKYNHNIHQRLPVSNVNILSCHRWGAKSVQALGGRPLRTRQFLNFLPRGGGKIGNSLESNRPNFRIKQAFVHIRMHTTRDDTVRQMPSSI